MTNKESQSSKIAEKNHQPSDYKSSDPIEHSLAMTHEQVSDTLIEGTIAGKIFNANGTNIDLPRKGYDQ